MIVTACRSRERSQTPEKSLEVTRTCMKGGNCTAAESRYCMRALQLNLLQAHKQGRLQASPHRSSQRMVFSQVTLVPGCARAHRTSTNRCNTHRRTRTSGQGSFLLTEQRGHLGCCSLQQTPGLAKLLSRNCSRKGDRPRSTVICSFRFLSFGSYTHSFTCTDHLMMCLCLALAVSP